MKKNSFPQIHQDQIITAENYQDVIIEIINEVVENRKLLHIKYERLVKELINLSRPISNKTILARYILSRVLKESDKIFNEAQILARQLCPKCKSEFSNYSSYSKKFH